MGKLKWNIVWSDLPSNKQVNPVPLSSQRAAKEFWNNPDMELNPPFSFLSVLFLQLPKKKWSLECFVEKHEFLWYKSTHFKALSPHSLAVINLRFMEKHILIHSKAQVGREARNTIVDSSAFFEGPDQEQSLPQITLIWWILALWSSVFNRMRFLLNLISPAICGCK